MAKRSLIRIVMIGLMLGGEVVPVTAWAAGPSPTRATARDRQQAQTHFTRGKDLYDKRKYEPALAELNLSLDAVASPNARLYISRCLREMGRLVPAYVEFGHTASDAKELGDHYQKTAQVALEERAELEKNLGFVEIRVLHPAVSTRLNVSLADVPRNEWTEPIAVVPGTIQVVVETTGQAPIKKTIDVGAGEKKSLAIDVEPTTPPEPAALATPAVKSDSTAQPPSENNVANKADTTTTALTTDGEAPNHRLVMYVGGGVALAGLTTFLIGGALANSTYSDLEKACGPAGPCPNGQGHQSDVESGKTEQTIANIGLVVFVIGAAVAVSMFVLDMRQQRGQQRAPPPKASSARAFSALGYSW